MIIGAKALWGGKEGVGDAVDYRGDFMYFSLAYTWYLNSFFLFEIPLDISQPAQPLREVAVHGAPGLQKR